MRFSLRDYQKKRYKQFCSREEKGIVDCSFAFPPEQEKLSFSLNYVVSPKEMSLVLAHREELLAQAKDKIEGMTEGAARVDIEQGEHTASEQSNVVVASIRSLRTERLERLKRAKDFGLIIYDECHHAAAEDNMRVLRAWMLRCRLEWNSARIYRHHNKR